MTSEAGERFEDHSLAAEVALHRLEKRAEVERRATQVIASVLRGDTKGNVIGAYHGSPTDANTDARGLLRALHEAGLRIEEARGD